MEAQGSLNLRSFFDPSSYSSIQIFKPAAFSSEQQSSNFPITDFSSDRRSLNFPITGFSSDRQSSNFLAVGFSSKWGSLKFPPIVRLQINSLRSSSPTDFPVSHYSYRTLLFIITIQKYCSNSLFIYQIYYSLHYS